MGKFLDEQGLTHLWGKIEDKIAGSGGSSSSTAADVSFDDTVAGIGADNVQAAIEYLADSGATTEVIQGMIDENRTWNNATLFDVLSPGVVPYGISNYSSATAAQLIDNINTYGSAAWYINKTEYMPTYKQLYDAGFRYILTCAADGTITLDVSLNSYKDSTIVWSNPTYGKVIYLWGKALIYVKDIAGLKKALSKIYYDNSTSGLTAGTLPKAIDELAAKINSLVDGNEVSY